MKRELFLTMDRLSIVTNWTRWAREAHALLAWYSDYLECFNIPFLPPEYNVIDIDVHGESHPVYETYMTLFDEARASLMRLADTDDFWTLYRFQDREYHPLVARAVGLIDRTARTPARGKFWCRKTLCLPNVHRAHHLWEMNPISWAELDW